MKLTDRVIKQHEGLKSSTLKLVTTEVLSSFSEKEMSEFKSFEDFFAEVDVQNAYEEEWDADHYEPYYLKVWQKFKKGALTGFEESKLLESKTPSQEFNLPVLGTIETKPLSVTMTNQTTGEDTVMEFKPETYEVLGESQTAYVCNQWYKEHKKIPQLIPKDQVKKFTKIK